MSEWTIYGSNGVAKAVVKELELHDEWMAECFLTITVNSAAPIDFEVGDYIYVPGIKAALQANALDDIKAYVIKDGKAVEISLYCKPMTDNERAIVQAGCLINFNRGLKK